MTFDVIVFFLVFGAASSACAASSHILLAMVGEVNRRKDDHSQTSYFAFSWLKVWREYRILYPNGKYAIALAVSTALAFALSLMAIYYLFGVLPKYALPSR